MLVINLITGLPFGDGGEGGGVSCRIELWVVLGIIPRYVRLGFRATRRPPSLMHRILRASHGGKCT